MKFEFFSIMDLIENKKKMTNNMAAIIPVSTIIFFLQMIFVTPKLYIRQKYFKIGYIVDQR